MTTGSKAARSLVQTSATLLVLVVSLLPFFLFWLLREEYAVPSAAFAAIVIIGVCHVWLAFVADSSLVYGDVREALTALLGLVPAYMALVLLAAIGALWPVYVAAAVDVVGILALLALAWYRSRSD